VPVVSYVIGQDTDKVVHKQNEKEK